MQIPLLSGVPSKLRPFAFDGNLPEDQMFAALYLRNSTLQIRHMVGDFCRTSIQVHWQKTSLKLIELLQIIMVKGKRGRCTLLVWNVLMLLKFASFNKKTKLNRQNMCKNNCSGFIFEKFLVWSNWILQSQFVLDKWVPERTGNGLWQSHWARRSQTICILRGYLLTSWNQEGRVRLIKYKMKVNYISTKNVKLKEE